MMLEARGTKWWVVNDDLPTCHACQVANDREVCQWMVATFKSTSLFASFARRGRLKWRQTDETLYQALKFFFPQQLELFVAFCKKVFECRGVARSPESATLMRIEDLIQGDISSSFDSTPQLSRLHDGLALAHTLSCIGLFIRWVQPAIQSFLNHYL